MALLCLPGIENSNEKAYRRERKHNYWFVCVHFIAEDQHVPFLELFPEGIGTLEQKVKGPG